MDESQFSIRPFSDSDFDIYAEIYHAVRPEVPISSESLRHFDESYLADLVHDRYVAEDRGTGTAVAIAGLFDDPFLHRMGKFWTFIFVRPEFQGRGVGTRLYELLLDNASRRNGVCLRTSVLGDEARGLSFSAHRGFVERQRLWHSVLDVDAVDLSQLPTAVRKWNDAGVEFTTLEKEGATDPHVLKQVFGLVTVGFADVPRMDPYEPWTQDRWEKSDMDGPKFVPDAWFLAKSAGAYIALSYAEKEPGSPGVLLQELTATRPEYRRRGLAFTLKLHVIEYARRHQFHQIRTTNDSSNEPMWKLNERIGFRRTSTTIQMERRLSG
jgi:mycothiol synthase